VVQETQPAQALSLAVPNLHGHGVDLGLRWPNGQRSPNRAGVAGVYATKPTVSECICANMEADFADQPNGEISSTMTGLIAAVYWIGGAIAFPFIGIINDRFGRRWSIFVCSAIMIAGAIIQGFSVNGLCSSERTRRRPTPRLTLFTY
jgi:MFS family permease